LAAPVGLPVVFGRPVEVAGFGAADVTFLAGATADGTFFAVSVDFDLGAGKAFWGAPPSIFFWGDLLVVINVFEGTEVGVVGGAR